MMSALEPDGPYISQPFGMQDKSHWESGRIYGVSGISLLTTIKGLTKEEAKIIVMALKAKP